MSHRIVSNAWGTTKIELYPSEQEAQERWDALGTGGTCVWLEKANDAWCVRCTYCPLWTDGWNAKRIQYMIDEGKKGVIEKTIFAPAWYNNYLFLISSFGTGLACGFFLCLQTKDLLQKLPFIKYIL